MKEILLTALVAGTVYAVPASLLAPPPIPSLTGLAGGLIGLWMAGERKLLAAGIGALAGVALGVLVHTYQHFAEGRLTPPEGLVQHVTVNSLLGAVIVSLTLFATLAARHVADRRA